jgi:hypothetical protein
MQQQQQLLDVFGRAQEVWQLASCSGRLTAVILLQCTLKSTCGLLLCFVTLWIVRFIVEGATNTVLKA